MKTYLLGRKHIKEGLSETEKIDGTLRQFLCGADIDSIIICASLLSASADHIYNTNANYYFNTNPNCQEKLSLALRWLSVTR